MQRELDDWLARLSDFASLNSLRGGAGEAPRDIKVHEALLPASFAVASYRASMLPLLGDEGESSLQGATADLARLPLQFAPTDMMVQLDDMEVAAMTLANLSFDLNDNGKAAS